MMAEYLSWNRYSRHWLSATALALVALFGHIYFRDFITGKHFVFFYPAILLASFLPLMPGLWTLLLCILGAWYCVLPPIYAFHISDPGDWVGLGVFSISGILALTIGERSRISFRKEKQAFEKTHQTSEQLRIFAGVVEYSNDFIGICTPDMAPIFVNEAGRKMVGLASMDEVMQTTVFDYFHPDDLPRIQNEAVPALTEKGNWSGECRFRNFKTGATIYTIWNAFVIRNAIGKPIALATISPNLNKLKESEDRLRLSLQEKDVLLREIHHRVKNNLNIISSLLELQAINLKTPGDRAPFLESQNRIRSMALIHEKLYQSRSIAKIDFATYVKDLVFAIYHSFGVDPKQIRPNVFVENVALDIDAAIPCSLIINELVSNALKYAFPNRTGTLTVLLTKKENGLISLHIFDDGIGLPTGFQLEESRSLGMRLVKALTKQMGGKLVVGTPKSGTSIHIDFSLEKEQTMAYA